MRKSTADASRHPGAVRPPEQAAAGELRERLATAGGRDFWRSLEELADSPEFQRLVEREFPLAASEFPDRVSRRRFLQLMSASLALGGLTACTRQPLETIVAYVEQPESLVPGNPLYFASTMPLDGLARPLLVESHMGRPTKVEGNPRHPASRGATDLLAQASVLTLYDPDRSQVVRHNGRIRTWEAFLDETRSALRALSALGGARLRILTRAVTSPSLADRIEKVLAAHPKAAWHQYTPVGRDPERRGLQQLFGQPLSVRYDLSRADVVVSLDSDFLTFGAGSVAYARDFAQRRQMRHDGSSICRLYAAESSPTNTGTLADHRLPARAAEVEGIAAALAVRLGVDGAAAAGPTTRLAAWIEAVAEDLERHPGRSLVIAGDFASPAVHALAHALNVHLGNLDSTVVYTAPVEARPEIEIDSLRLLVDDMEAGEVDVLLVLGCNPVYETPADVGFAAAMNKVARRIHLGLYEDETAELCQWHLPEAHYLESWGDCRAFDGSVCLTQPIIEPLHGGKSAAEVLSVLVDEADRGARELMRDYWQRQWGAEDFEKAWQQALHDGFVSDSAAPRRAVTVAANAVAAACRSLAAAEESGELEILYRPDPTVYDGSFNNNGWLQECPKPLTKLTWDNAALVGPALAERLGLESEQMVELAVDGRTLQMPVWVLPGHPDGAVTLHLGYGRRRAGRVGRGTGFNVFALRGADSPWLARRAELRKTTGSYPLASTQLHQNIALEGRESKRRHLVRSVSIGQLERDPDIVHRMGHPPADELSLYPHVEYPGHAWGLTVDLSACTGCNACVIACQAENNVPIVGKDLVALGREMHWLRIDRYFQGDPRHPQVHHQPVMCMHCEQAPCEPVCPVAATVHSDEGLNDMVYNRCVGTRYCSNNCPYKVRRFNFLKYNDTQTPLLKMLRNPDVTVRSRGVMEKCTYCVQRINRARIEARREDRDIRDGDIQTACQQVCPSRAIVFGDINDSDSAVTRSKSHPLSYGILEELGTRPRTSYLAKLRNPNEALEETRDDAA